VEERKEFDGFARDATAAIVNFDWPGNVRELQNVNRNMVVMNHVGEVPAAMLPPRIVSLAPSGGSLEGPTPHMTSTLQSADAQGTIPPPICRMTFAPGGYGTRRNRTRDRIE
jgi:two-component system repressor protein LuxO